MSDPIGEMTQLHVGNNNTISMKVVPCTTEEVFVDPFPKDLETLFLEEDGEFAIEDKDTLRQKMRYDWGLQSGQSLLIGVE